MKEHIQYNGARDGDEAMVQLKRIKYRRNSI